jgi:iron-sulfur cluster repair protein YtfE (RIC family)
MSNTATIDPAVLNAIANMTVSDLVESNPETMSILAPFGLDLCCGGGRPVGEALALHGADVEPVLCQIALLAHPGLEK